jgi:hypothetical protein
MAFLPAHFLYDGLLTISAARAAPERSGMAARTENMERVVVIAIPCIAQSRPEAL